MSNEHFGYPSTTLRASASVQAIKRLIRKMRMHALDKGDTDDAVYNS